MTTQRDYLTTRTSTNFLSRQFRRQKTCFQVIKQNSTINDIYSLETQRKLLVVAKKRKIYPELERILGELDKLKEFHAGIHDHDLVFDAPDVVKRDLSERQKQNLRNIAIAKGARKDIKIYHVEKIVDCLPSLFKNIEIGQKLCNSIEKNKKRSYPFADAQIFKVEDLTPPTKRISSSVFVDEELGDAMKAFKITDADYELKFFS